MQMTRIIVLCCVLLVVAPLPCFAAEDATGAQDGPAPAVIFEGAASDQLLEEVEACRIQLPLLRDLVAKDEQLDEIRVEREALLRERIAFLEKQQGELLRMNEAAIKNVELARKSAGATWYEQLFAASKWVGLGILLGFTVGAGR